MINLKFILLTCIGIMLCTGNVVTMEPQQEPLILKEWPSAEARLKLHQEYRQAKNKENAQKMMLMKEHMNNLSIQQEDVRFKMGETLHQITKPKVFRCPTKEEMKAHEPGDHNGFARIIIDGVEFHAHFGDISKSDKYTHAHVTLHHQGFVMSIRCGLDHDYYAAVTEPKFRLKDITFDVTSAVPEGENENAGAILPLNTEFTIHEHK